MKISLEINAPTPEEFGELIFTLLSSAAGLTPESVEAAWQDNAMARDIYTQAGSVIRDMQLAYYKAGVEAGVQAAQIGGPIESQN